MIEVMREHPDEQGLVVRQLRVRRFARLGARLALFSAGAALATSAGCSGESSPQGHGGMGADVSTGGTSGSGGWIRDKAGKWVLPPDA
jgi:hypothetical protein